MKFRLEMNSNCGCVILEGTRFYMPDGDADEWTKKINSLKDGDIIIVNFPEIYYCPCCGKRRD